MYLQCHTILVLTSLQKSTVNQPICVAEVNILKFKFSQFVEKIPCVYVIFHLHKRTNKQYQET